MGNAVRPALTTMRILVISDIHANITAFQAVIQDAGQVDAIWCLGDVVGYGPDPNECVALLSSLPGLTCLVGNHDAAALGEIDLAAFNRDASLSSQWTQSTLTPENLAFLRGLPEKLVNQQVTLAHGSPRNPVWEYLLDTITAASNFEFFNTPLCFVGHTHLPVAYIMDEKTHYVDWRLMRHLKPFTFEGRTIINPGSVGQPRDRDPRAAYAIYYPEKNLWEPYRVEYDIPSVQQRILDAGLPQRHALRLADGW
jgi:predicted phosphodiesterase